MNSVYHSHFQGLNGYQYPYFAYRAYYPVPLSMPVPYSYLAYPVYSPQPPRVYPAPWSPYFGYQSYVHQPVGTITEGGEQPPGQYGTLYGAQHSTQQGYMEDTRFWPNFKVKNPLPDLKKKAEDEAKKLAEKAKKEAAKAAEKAKQEAAKAAAKAAEKAKQEAAKAAAKAAEKAKQEAAQAAAKLAEKAKQEAAQAAAKLAEKAKQQAALEAAKLAEKAKQEAAQAAAKLAEKAKQQAALEAAKLAEKAKQQAALEAAKLAEKAKQEAQKQIKVWQKKVADEIDFPKFSLPTKLDVGDYSLPLQIGSPCPETADSIASEYPMTTVGGVPEFKAELCSTGVCIFMKKSKFSVIARLCHPRSIEDYAKRQLENCQNKASQAAGIAFAQSLAASSASLGAAIPAAISVALSTYKTSFTNCIMQVSELKELEKYIKLSIYAKRLSTEPWKKI
ncbi:hypothetical protein [Paenibacillus eucommiae]|uniref:Chemotaxis protein histidine kinase CheA n=1 Tax=Paenibacillus eucommiae TaxID=1355755 RepID=A0ABS4J5G6_9BACL|nr:hypothetical protein [Paenibacillus eucommiae]MBP1995073.1 chemotaxis protein histidine kinase CheA [Paenibacillus eucommiae]